MGHIVRTYSWNSKCLGYKKCTSLDRRITNAIIHVNFYYTILRLIERELVNLELSLEERVQIGLAHIEFQRFFYSG